MNNSRKRIKLDKIGFNSGQIECIKTVCAAQKKYSDTYISGSTALCFYNKEARNFVFNRQHVFVARHSAKAKRKILVDSAEYSRRAVTSKMHLALPAQRLDRYALTPSIEHFMSFNIDGIDTVLPTVEYAFFQTLDEYLKGHHNLYDIVKLSSKLKFSTDAIKDLINIYSGSPRIIKLILYITIINRHKKWADVSIYRWSNFNAKVKISKDEDAVEIHEIRAFVSEKDAPELKEINNLLNNSYAQQQLRNSNKYDIEETKSEITRLKHKIEVLKYKLIDLKDKDVHVDNPSDQIKTILSGTINSNG